MNMLDMTSPKEEKSRSTAATTCNYVLRRLIAAAVPVRTNIVVVVLDIEI